MQQEARYLRRGTVRARRNFADRDFVIKVHQDLSQIEYNDFRFVAWPGSAGICSFHSKERRRLYFISRRPSRARLRVTSSANSKPLPAGRPCAIRDTTRPGRASRFAK